MTEETTDTALLVMDVQPNIVERLSDKDSYMQKATKAVEFAHRHKIPVIYVVVGFRAGYPEVGPSSKMFQAIKAMPRATMVDPAPAIPPTGTDIVVTKRRVSAFTGSDLEVLLRAQGIRHLVLAGIATSGVVLSTLREAADKDYELTVLSDVCADFDDEVHTLLTKKVFPRQASVIELADWMAA
jgi:nicotinamidase-related amidase